MHDVYKLDDVHAVDTLADLEYLGAYIQKSVALGVLRNLPT